LGHRGVIVALQFLPNADSMRLLSSAEDFTVKVWDLVLNKEVASLKENKGRVSCFAFTND
jgi:WD40 repeat protein